MQRLDGGGDSGHRWAPRPARRRRWRLREARELVQVLDAGEPAHLLELARLPWAGAGLRRLDDRDALAAGVHKRHQRHDHDGLA